MKWDGALVQQGSSREGFGRVSNREIAEKGRGEGPSFRTDKRFHGTVACFEFGPFGEPASESMMVGAAVGIPRRNRQARQNVFKLLAVSQIGRRERALNQFTS